MGAVTGFHCTCKYRCQIMMIKQVDTERSRKFHAHLVPLRGIGSKFANERLVDTNKYILRFDISVDNFTLGV